MTLSDTFLTWGNSRAVLLPARAFAAYCGKRRKIVRERCEKFPQQGLFDHGAGGARARLEWGAVLPAALPSKLLRELTGRTGRAAGGLALACVVAACVRGRCLRVRPAPYVDRRGVAPLTCAWPESARVLGTCMARPACVLGARMARSRSCTRRPHIRIADRVAGNELRPGIPNGPIIFYQW